VGTGKAEESGFILQKVPVSRERIKAQIFRPTPPARRLNQGENFSMQRLKTALQLYLHCYDTLWAGTPAQGLPQEATMAEIVAAHVCQPDAVGRQNVSARAFIQRADPRSGISVVRISFGSAYNVLCCEPACGINTARLLYR
jgi:hypothetical protein